MTLDSTDTQSPTAASSDALQRILDVLPMLQSAVTVLFQDECRRHSIPETEVQCIVDASDAELGCAKIEPGRIPLIRLNAAWIFDAIFNGKSDVVVECIKRCAIIAHKRLRWTLSGNKPRTALDYIERQRAFRESNPTTFSLPEKHFRTSLTVTMSDALTGETLTRDSVRVSELADVQKELAHELTVKVYAHQQVAEILDTLHAHKEAASEVPSLASVGITMVSADWVIQSLTYEDVR